MATNNINLVKNEFIIKAPKAGEHVSYAITPEMDISLTGIDLENVKITIDGDNVEILLPNESIITFVNLVQVLNVNSEMFLHISENSDIKITDLLNLKVGTTIEPAAGPKDSSDSLHISDIISPYDDFIIPTFEDNDVFSNESSLSDASPFIFQNNVHATRSEEVVINTPSIDIKELVETDPQIINEAKVVVEEVIITSSPEPEVVEPVINNIIGTDKNDKLYGTDDIDNIDGGAGKDKLYGGNGNDILIYDEIDKLIDGGEGIDTLKVNDDSEIDLNKGKTIKKIERIDLNNGEENELEVSIKDVLKTSDDNILEILGDNLDEVEAEDFVTRGADITANDIVFATFSAGGASLYVELGITFNDQILLESII
jgi:hypothetical protein